MLFASGIPTVESSWIKKYGGTESFWAYRERTSILFPMPPGKGSVSVVAKLPVCVHPTCIGYPLNTG